MSKVYGDWKKLKKALNNLGKFTDDIQEVGKKAGEYVELKIKDNIENQSLNLAPLAQEYWRRKIAEGYDPRILIRTGEYLDSIKIVDIQETGNGISIFVGVEDGITETGISMSELATYIEYGTRKQPARLPITQSWEKMRSEVRRMIIEEIQVAFKGAVR